MKLVNQKFFLKLLLTVLAFFAGINISTAQLTVDGSLTAEQLVRDILLGGGVEVFNVVYTGGNTPGQNPIGTFDGTGSPDLGIDEGIILTSGSINVAPGPNDNSGATFANGVPGDPDLDALIPGYSTLDASVIEFDFIPIFDNITFNYVFASEEYQEYVCSPFNDVFGFFVSGPGIVGTINIAQIPGSGDAVAINTVNNGSFGPWGSTPGPFDPCPPQNPGYYVDNDVLGSPGIQYDGFTVVLPAVLDNLIPCETYHIKLAIADAGDEYLDSGIFLESGSFTSVGAYGGTDQEQDLCSNVPTQVGREPFAGLTFSWTPTTGLDNPNIANPFLTLYNPTNSPMVRTYSLYILECDLATDFTFTVYPGVYIDLGDDVALPSGSNIIIGADPARGTPPFQYSWAGPQIVDASAQYQTIYTPPGPPETYTVTVIDAQGCQTSDDIVISAIPGSDDFTWIDDYGNTPDVCLGVPVNFTGIGVDDMNGWNWDFGDGSESVEGQDAVHTFDCPGTYEVVYTVWGVNYEYPYDEYSTEITHNVNVVNSGCPMTMNITDLETCRHVGIFLGPEPIVCDGTPMQTIVRGGSGDYRFRWWPERYLGYRIFENPFFSNPTRNQYFTLQVFDNVTGNMLEDRILVTVLRDPRVRFRRRTVRIKKGSSYDLSTNLRIIGNGGFSYAWRTLDGSDWTSSEDSPVVSPTRSTSYGLVITDIKGCSSRMARIRVIPSRRKEAAFQPGNAEFDGFFTAYPNPAVDELAISLQSEYEGPVGIRLVNMVGVTVYNSTGGYAVDYYETIDVSGLPAGVYMIEVHAGNSKVLEKVVIN